MNYLDRLPRLGARLAHRLLDPHPNAKSTADDPFAGYRSLDGPSLASGPEFRHDAALDGDPHVVVLLPHLNVEKMSGGPNTVLQLTARLLPEIKVRYVATSGPLAPDRAAMVDHIHSVTGVEAAGDDLDFVDASARRASVSLGRDDVLIATYWPTAHLAQAGLDLVRASEFIYIVQDFEPGFYAWSSHFASAQATYAMPMRAIVNEPFLESFLRDGRIGRFAGDDLRVSTFMPAVDRAIFSRRSDRPAHDPRRLVFYARPRNPRNLFEIGLRVLREAAGRGVFDAQPWEFLAVGQDLPDLRLSERHVLQAQPWLSYERYGALLGSSDVLLSLMLSPHTSYPPLEMAVAGGLVVTNTYGPKTVAGLAAISPAIRAAPPEVESLVAVLAAAVSELADLERAPRTQSVATLPETWDDALRDVVPWLAHQAVEMRTG